jgi:chemotaxis response regulator CheB
MRVVIADDSRIARMFLHSALRSGDFQIVGEAATGKEVVDVCRRLKPDLVLLDNSMPVMAGSDAAAKIREQETAKFVIVLSSLAMDAITGGPNSTVWRDKGIGFIGKTNDGAQLRGLIAEQLAALAGG